MPSSPEGALDLSVKPSGHASRPAPYAPPPAARDVIALKIDDDVIPKCRYERGDNTDSTHGDGIGPLWWEARSPVGQPKGLTYPRLPDPPVGLNSSDLRSPARAANHAPASINIHSTPHSPSLATRSKSDDSFASSVNYDVTSHRMTSSVSGYSTVDVKPHAMTSSASGHPTVHDVRQHTPVHDLRPPTQFPTQDSVSPNSSPEKPTNGVFPLSPSHGDHPPPCRLSPLPSSSSAGQTIPRPSETSSPVTSWGSQNLSDPKSLARELSAYVVASRINDHRVSPKRENNFRDSSTRDSPPVVGSVSGVMSPGRENGHEKSHRAYIAQDYARGDTTLPVSAGFSASGPTQSCSVRSEHELDRAPLSEALTQEERLKTLQLLDNVRSTNQGLSNIRLTNEGLLNQESLHHNLKRERDWDEYRDAAKRRRSLGVEEEENTQRGPLLRDNERNLVGVSYGEHERMASGGDSVRNTGVTNFDKTLDRVDSLRNACKEDTNGTLSGSHGAGERVGSWSRLGEKHWGTAESQPIRDMESVDFDRREERGDREGRAGKERGDGREGWDGRQEKEGVMRRNEWEPREKVLPRKEQRDSADATEGRLNNESDMKRERTNSERQGLDLRGGRRELGANIEVGGSQDVTSSVSTPSGCSWPPSLPVRPPVGPPEGPGADQGGLAAAALYNGVSVFANMLPQLHPLLGLYTQQLQAQRNVAAAAGMLGQFMGAPTSGAGHGTPPSLLASLPITTAADVTKGVANWSRLQAQQLQQQPLLQEHHVTQPKQKRARRRPDNKSHQISADVIGSTSGVASLPRGGTGSPWTSLGDDSSDVVTGSQGEHAEDKSGHGSDVGEQRDSAYFERRRKNNEAAKRSRDSRRQKEEEVALRAAVLEQENLQLRAELAILKGRSAELHRLLFDKMDGGGGGGGGGGAGGQA